MENRDEIKQKIRTMSEDELVDQYIKNQQTEAQLEWYREQLSNLNKVRFGSTSEKLSHGQLNLFNEVEDCQDNPIIEEEEPKKAKAKKKREANFSKLPTKVIVHELENKICDVCNSEMKELAPIVMEVLKYQPARYTVEKHIIHQYICPTCTDENLEAEIVIAPGTPKRLIKGSVASASVVAGIAFNKYVSGIPLYRQEQELKRKRVEISRMNMSNWLMHCAQDKFKPMFELMNRDIRLSKYIHMDESTLVVLEDKKDGRQKSYMWLAMSGKWEEKQMALYFYHQSREYAVAKDILGEDYDGTILCDAYEAYHNFLKAVVCGCMAHVRRYFVDALEVNPVHKQMKGKTKAEQEQLCRDNPGYAHIHEILRRIKLLFKFEATYIELGYDPETILKKRQVDQQTIFDELFQYIANRENEYPPKSKMGKAITYALNQTQYVGNYLKYGEAELSNNRGERGIKPFVIGRKAWLFSNTKSGAESSSIYYSMVESAKMNHLDVHKYLEYVLEELTNMEKPKESDYERLLPYSKDLPDYLRC